MKIKVLQVNGAVFLYLAGENATEWQKLRQFVEQLNGRPIDKEKAFNNPVFDCPVRVESVGFDGDGSIESIAFMGEPG